MHVPESRQHRNGRSGGGGGTLHRTSHAACHMHTPAAQASPMGWQEGEGPLVWEAERKSYLAA